MRFLQRAVVFAITRSLGWLPFGLLETGLFRGILRSKFPEIRASRKIPKRENVWDFAVETINGSTAKVLYLEFGVYKGYSIRHFTSRIANAESRFYGFDSFEGLPESWAGKRIGKFSTGGQAPAMDDTRVTFVKGWFQNSLATFSVDASKFDVVLVHLDADLYASALFVLSDLWHRFESFYVVFDEFSGDETRALYNFSQAFPSRIEFLAYDDDVNPQRVFCRVAKAQISLPGTPAAP